MKNCTIDTSWRPRSDCIPENILAICRQPINHTLNVYTIVDVISWPEALICAGAMLCDRQDV